jgi:dihydroflavonol-4-reductase
VPQLAAQGMKVVQGDVTVPASLAEHFPGHDVVLHLAAVVGKDAGDWAHHDAVGVQGTRNVVEAAARSGVSRLVHLSSCIVYAQPPRYTAVTENSPLETRIEPWNHYLRQKLESELLVRQASGGKLGCVVVRPPTVLGPGDPNLVPFLRAVARSPLGAVAADSGHHFPVVVAEDLAEGIAAAALVPRVSDVYNLAAARAMTKAELLGAMAASGADVAPPGGARKWVTGAAAGVFDALELALGPLGELSHAPRRLAVARLEQYAKRRAQPDLLVEAARAQHDLGFGGARSITDAISRTATWYASGTPALG